MILANKSPQNKVKDYKNILSWILESEKDTRVRIASAWKARSVAHYVERGLKIILIISVVLAFCSMVLKH